MNQISYDFVTGDANNRDTEFVILDPEEILPRLGPAATDADVKLFIKLWNARFYDEGGKPTFYDHDDVDRTWTELRDML